MNGLMNLISAFTDIHRAHLDQGRQIMSGIANLQAAVDKLQASVERALPSIQTLPGDDASLDAIANTLLGLAAELDDAAAGQGATSTATATASSSSSATATATSSSSSTATAPAPPARAAARRQPAAPPADEHDGTFRG